MVYLSRITTKTGDDGTTAIGDGSRVSKLDSRIIAGGTVDELNCLLGLAAAQVDCGSLLSSIRQLQQWLFDLGADLCVPLPAENSHPADAATTDQSRRIAAHHVTALEQQIDEFNQQLAPLNSFVLPGGSLTAATLHLARSVCRRAERDVLSLQMNHPVNAMLPIFLNRLSDLLFVMARHANQDQGSEILWQPSAG